MPVSLPHNAEASAILRGLRVAVDSGLFPAELESDAKWVVDMINNRQSSCADIGIICKDIVYVMTQFDISVKFVSRQANRAAHALAKLALVYDRNFTWEEDFPLSIASVIWEDSLP
ncbi:hypothetical protein Dsin_014073 [Dipteronia sinensis]|uniref:RNase H type-1 domain-containing protein n=1 Tax=Dipteronia sinensis TaxID=43782 RepID=A0AAE0E9H5_9ROSI|nr:hypothetical protein Dsin_014073 [Dipteronia sinensis]